jgi:exopolysaccharide biosynthesis polyprenyl glycosylphosphotransferase
MSTLRADEPTVLLEVNASATASAEASRGGGSLPGICLRALASAGQAAVVLPAVVVPGAAGEPVRSEQLLALFLMACVWTTTVHAAFAAGNGILGIWPSAAIGSVAGLAIVVAVSPALPGPAPRATSLAGMSVGVLVSAAVWEWAVRRVGVRRRRVLVVGTSELSNDMAEELARADIRDYELIGHIGDPRANGTGGRVPFAGTLSDLATVVEEQEPDLIVLADERTYGQALDELLDGPRTRARVIGVAGFFEYVLGRIPVSQLSSAWFMSLVHLRQPAHGRWTKRAFDVTGALVGFVLALPLMLMVAIIVSRTPGPLLYRQTRLGEGGKPFTMYKFRTMAVGAECAGPQFSGERDPRVIPGGRLVRRAHLDELPQLWNVLKGEMSIVGPRPERPEIATPLEDAIPFWHRRLLIKPGITGWAQVNCGYVADCERMADKLAYDLWYARHRSLVVDVAICLRTVSLQLRALLP